MTAPVSAQSSTVAMPRLTRNGDIFSRHRRHETARPPVSRAAFRVAADRICASRWRLLARRGGVKCAPRWRIFIRGVCAVSYAAMERGAILRIDNAQQYQERGHAEIIDYSVGSRRVYRRRQQIRIRFSARAIRSDRGCARTRLAGRGEKEIQEIQEAAARVGSRIEDGLGHRERASRTTWPLVALPALG